MSILNIDGSFNNSARTVKHILELIGKTIIPVAILVITIVFTTILKEAMSFYMEMIVICLSFFIAGILVDNLVISFLDDELNIREKVKEANAISRRTNIK